MNTTRKIISGMAVAALTVMLAACASGDGRYADMPTHRYYDENPYAFDSDAYYDPTYNLRRDGEFRPRYRMKPYN
jgi:hypothetical protein